MFSKILIANRGEIACRIMRTARAMGIKTVAVYSDADARAKHVSLADEAVRLGPAPAAESYLNMDAILRACAETGAEAVHPGYGFLSERAAFAQALIERGIAFIGPPPAAIAAMGDKIESKKLARAAGVSVTPGFVGEIEGPDHAASIAAEIGYPVMLKASAGGGGKGMRLAWSEAELRETFQSVRDEAKASFGDDRVFIEKFIENPRHIEIQILADKHGTVLHLGERECSIQRRHQKVIEEAPSPFVTPEMRAAMGAEAVRLARAVSYESAGTVEFIVGADRSFYFLEMNTRLQVEHPVTEIVTGLDLVEQMIRVAAGQKLSFAQDDVRLSGWAIEARVYAEDPYRGFLPSIGRLTRYRPPPDGEGVRVDDGVVEGSDISMFYDPMIAKLIGAGATRAQAAARCADALARFEVEGVGANLDLLEALMRHPRFLEGRLSTGFIAEEYPDGFAGAPLPEPDRPRLAALCAMLAARTGEIAGRVSGQLNGYLAPRDYCVRLDGEDWPARVETLTPAAASVRVGDSAIEVAGAWSPSQRLFDGAIAGEPFAAFVRRDGGAHWRVRARGAQRRLRVLPASVAELARLMPDKPAPDLSKVLLCPMPGMVVDVFVAAGDRVEAGQPLAIVEAMKMQNLLRAEKAGIVSEVRAAKGDRLAVDAVILTFA